MLHLLKNVVAEKSRDKKMNTFKLVMKMILIYLVFKIGNDH